MKKTESLEKLNDFNKCIHTSSNCTNKFVIFLLFEIDITFSG